MDKSAFKALRVPIGILQGKVFPMGCRLPHVDILKPEKPKQQTGISRWVERFGPDQPMPTAATSTGEVFEHLPYLRRFFYRYGASKDIVVCRGCGTICLDFMMRAQHTRCYPVINKVLQSICDLGICVVCDQEIKATISEQYWKFKGLPLCSDACQGVWDCMSPLGYDTEKDALKTAGNLPKVWGTQ